jgi:flagellar biosynthetic protein FliP
VADLQRAVVPTRRHRRRLGPLLVALPLLALAVIGVSGGAVSAQAPDPDVPVPPAPIEVPELPTLPDPDGTTTGLPARDEAGDGTTDAETTASFALDVPDVTGDSSNVVVIILLLSVLSIAPSLLVLTTSFTRIVIVMSLARNALGIPTLPPQQVIVGLSLFLSLFVMAPTLGEMNEVGLQPLIAGELSFTEAAEAASAPLREFMLKYTREGELEMFLDASDTETPVARDEVPLTALIPAFVLSEIKSAFILGFVIFVPFLVIDLVVSAVLTSLGMMMLPPTFVSLPLKLLLFVLLDGWTLIVGTLLTSYG